MYDSIVAVKRGKLNALIINQFHIESIWLLDVMRGQCFASLCQVADNLGSSLRKVLDGTFVVLWQLS